LPSLRRTGRRVDTVERGRGHPYNGLRMTAESPEGSFEELQQRARELVDAGRLLYGRGMVPATSGNFSARLSDGRIAITVSGAHKGRLSESDIMVVDAQGAALEARRPSAETLLHVQIYHNYPDAMVVLHPHSVNATVVSRFSGDELVLRDYELLKAFPGIDTHERTVTVPVFANDQDIVRLARRIDDYLEAHDPMYGYLIEGHGFYTWGAGIDDALRHVEAFEFLFECEICSRGMERS